MIHLFEDLMTPPDDNISEQSIQTSIFDLWCQRWIWFGSSECKKVKLDYYIAVDILFILSFFSAMESTPKGCTIGSIFVFCDGYILLLEEVKKYSWIVFQSWHLIGSKLTPPSYRFEVKVWSGFTWFNILWWCPQIFTQKGILSE